MNTIGSYDNGMGGTRSDATPDNGNGAVDPGDGADAPTTVAALLEDLKEQAKATDEDLADSTAQTQQLTKSKADLQKQIADLTKTSDALAGKRKTAQSAVDEAEHVIHEYTPLLIHILAEDIRDGILEAIADVGAAITNAGKAARRAGGRLVTAEEELAVAAAASAAADQKVKDAQASLNGLVTEIQDLTAKVVALGKEVAAKTAASLEPDAFWRLQQLTRAAADLATLIDPQTEQDRVAAVGVAAAAAATASQELRVKTAARDAAKEDFTVKDAEWKAKQKSREADIKQKIDDLVNSPPDAPGHDAQAAGVGAGAGAALP